MRKIPLSFGLLYFLDELEASEAALSADPDAQALAAPFREALEEWDGMFKRERAARREVIRAEAVVGVRNEQLDALTTRFAAMVRAVAPGLLQKLFTVAPGRFIRRGLRSQSEKTRDVIVPELAKLEGAHPLQPFAPELQGGAEGALAALNARSAAKGARQTTANDVDEWKEGVNALRTTTYAELLKIATEKGYPKSWVESFFRSASSGSDAEGEEAAEPPAASDPTPG
jgi:hypothetical protein